MLVALSSRSGNKLDQYVHISSDLDIARRAGGASVTVRLTVTNEAPVGEPKIVTGATDGSGVGEGTYLGVLAVNLPGAARQGRIDGVSQLTVAGPDGPTRVVGFMLQLDRGQRRTVVVRFSLPGSSGVVRVEPSARVPPIAWANGALRWSDSQPHVVRWP
jgi:hypothetical protein